MGPPSKRRKRPKAIGTAVATQAVHTRAGGASRLDGCAGRPGDPSAPSLRRLVLASQLAVLVLRPPDPPVRRRGQPGHVLKRAVIAARAAWTSLQHV
jgi:hypothetical protein